MSEHILIGQTTTCIDGELVIIPTRLITHAEPYCNGACVGKGKCVLYPTCYPEVRDDE